MIEEMGIQGFGERLSSIWGWCKEGKEETQSAVIFIWIAYVHGDQSRVLVATTRLELPIPHLGWKLEQQGKLRLGGLSWDHYNQDQESRETKSTGQFKLEQNSKVTPSSQNFKYSTP